MINELLLKKAMNGDSDSFYKLLEPIKDSLYKVSFMYLKNEDDALDCIHEAIIKAIKSLNNLKEPQYFNTWMMRVTANVCKDYIKKNNKVVFVDIQDYENTFIAKEENQFEHKEDIEMALNKLTEKERDLIVMRYLDDMSLKSISTEISTPIGTIKSRLNRTLKKLRAHMEGI